VVWNLEHELLRGIGRLTAAHDVIHSNTDACISRTHGDGVQSTNPCIAGAWPDRLATEVPSALEASGCVARLRDRRFLEMPAPLQDNLPANDLPCNADLHFRGRRYDLVTSREEAFLAVADGS
jgi:hypothetical protein